MYPLSGGLEAEPPRDTFVSRLCALCAPEKQILETVIALKAQPDRAGEELEALSARLLNWASGVIEDYAAR